MLPKINRIRKKKDFEVVFKEARRAPQSFKNDFLIFKILKNKLEINRFGFVVSQKVSKKATIRNKIKRRLSEAIKSQIKNMGTGIDLVLIALPGIEKKDLPTIKENIISALIKTRLVVRK